jgi:hypothetical protein
LSEQIQIGKRSVGRRAWRRIKDLSDCAEASLASELKRRENTVITYFTIFGRATDESILSLGSAIFLLWLSGIVFDAKIKYYKTHNYSNIA